MKKIVSLILIMCSCFLIAAGNAGGLRYREYWFRMLTPVQKYDFTEFLTQLDLIRADHPKLMTEEAYAGLKELGESALLASGPLTLDEDPFEGTLYLWPSSLARPGEDQRIVPYIERGTAIISFVIVSEKWWLNAEKAIFLGDTGDKMTINVKPWDHAIDRTLSNDYMEIFAPSFGYGEDEWRDMINNEALSSVAVRFYGEDGRTEDYTLTEDEITAIRDVLNLQYAKKQLSDALQKWCESIEKINE